jgi:Tol biopolymer transport system component
MTLSSYKSTKITPLLSTHNFTKFFCLIALLALLGGTTSAQGQSPATGLISTNSVGNGSGNVGAYAPSVSADGRFVVFVSASRDLVPNDINESEDVFVRDRQTGLTKMVSINLSGTGGGDQHSSNPTITTRRTLRSLQRFFH